MGNFELYTLAKEYQSRGNVDMYLKTLEDLVARDRMFSPAQLDLGQFFLQTGNLMGAKQKLIDYLNAYQTGLTFTMVQWAQQQIGEIEKKLNPQQSSQPK